MTRWELFIKGGGPWWWLRHLIFWIALYLDELILTVFAEDGTTYLDLFVVAVILDMIMVYFNLYQIIPQVIAKKDYASLIVKGGITVFINVLLLTLYYRIRIDDIAYPEDLAATTISTATLLATAIAIKLSKHLYDQAKITEELKSHKTQIELDYLKQQINPHFLFNVLNTIHIQAQAEPNKVSESVLQLSELLRYQIYEAGSQDTIGLQKEIQFLKNYASLEQMRRYQLQLNWNQPPSIPNIKISPFLFLPFIENAFKHSQRMDEQISQIDIDWLCDSERIQLKVSNTLGNVSGDKEGGFGLENLKQRLDLIYGDRYELITGVEDDRFVSSLSILI